jgi:hypothetical protein
MMVHWNFRIASGGEIASSRAKYEAVLVHLGCFVLEVCRDQETPQDSAQSGEDFDHPCFKRTIVRLWPACRGRPSSCAKNAEEWLRVVPIGRYHSVDRDRIRSNSR